MKRKLISLMLLIPAFGCMAYASHGGPGVTDDAPKGWFRACDRPQNYEMRLDTATKHGGRAGARIRFIGDKAEGFGALMQAFKADVYRGKRLRMSAWMRTENADSAH